MAIASFRIQVTKSGQVVVLELPVVTRRSPRRLEYAVSEVDEDHLTRLVIVGQPLGYDVPGGWVHLIVFPVVVLLVYAIRRP